MSIEEQKEGNENDQKNVFDNHKIVSQSEWIEARRDLLTEEKEFTILRDQLNQKIRDLPWVRVDKEYVFDGPTGKQTLSELFDGKSQLIVYHFMYAPGWDAGCPSCSFWADNFNGIGVKHTACMVFEKYADSLLLWTVCVLRNIVVEGFLLC